MTELHKMGHKVERSCLKTWHSAFFVFLSVVAFAQVARAQRDPLASASSPLQSRSQFAIDDFDGDNRPDLASAEVGQRNGRDARYQIRFQLTTGPLQTIGLTAPVGGLQLRSRDVNGDNFPDIVVTTFWSNQPVAVLLNDGLGNFSKAEPSRFPEAFTSSEVSITSGTHTSSDAAATLFPRYFFGECEGRASISPPRAVGRFIGDNFHFIVLSGSDIFFGRAPPSVDPRN